MAYKVYLSPSSQTDNNYIEPKTTEAVQCGFIASFCAEALERCGIQTKIGHCITLAQKCQESNAFNADLHVPIHTNAASNGEQDFIAGTRLFASAKGNPGWKACEAISKYLFPLSPGTSDAINVNTTWYEIKNTNAYTAYIEAEFHDNRKVSAWITEHVEAIGEAIAHGICDYFKVTYKPKEVPKPAAKEPDPLPPILDDIETPVVTPKKRTWVVQLNNPKTNKPFDTYDEALKYTKEVQKIYPGAFLAIKG